MKIIIIIIINHGDDRQCVLGRRLRNRRDETQHPSVRVHVPRRSTSLLDHASWKMVKHGVPEMHQETGPGVLARHLLKNDRYKVIHTHQNPTETNSMENIVDDSFSLLMG